MPYQRSRSIYRNISLDFPAIKYGFSYTKKLERQKFLALKKSNDNYDAKMPLSPELPDDLDWWISNILTAINPVRDDLYDLVIFSDASL